MRYAAPPQCTQIESRPVALNAYARTATDKFLTPVGRSLVRIGATPNGLTTVGLITTFAGAAVVVSGYHLVGALILALGTATDAFDGVVARLRGNATKFGAFYDSVTDRVSDVVLFGVAIWLVHDDPLLFVIALIALGGALLTSYIRAKAESLGWHATVGLLEHAERVIIMIIAIAVDMVPVALWILAVGAVITVVQRLREVMLQAGLMTS
jgi:CDP-diacylglycerol--glycerol-3-phosphate 3-phosphatidyltransferase